MGWIGSNFSLHQGLEKSKMCTTSWEIYKYKEGMGSLESWFEAASYFITLVDSCVLICLWYLETTKSHKYICLTLFINLEDMVETCRRLPHLMDEYGYIRTGFIQAMWLSLSKKNEKDKNVRNIFPNNVQYRTKTNTDHERLANQIWFWWRIWLLCFC